MATVNKQCYDDIIHHFTFHYLPNRNFQLHENKTSAEYLHKWWMNLNLQAFSFDQPFRAYMANDFALCFFQDPNVLSSLKTMSSDGNWSSLGVPATKVTVQMVPSTVTSMSFLQRLQNDVIVHTSGRIVKCFDEYLDEIVVADELRKMLLIEDSDNYDYFTSQEREEFLFKLFLHLCIGGSLCQYEDEIDAYLQMTKDLYKDIVTVHKDRVTKNIGVSSTVLKVVCYNGEDAYYPPDPEHIQNFCYLSIDPMKQHVNVLSHFWK